MRFKTRGFTLVEVMLCLVIFLIGGLSVAGSIVYARKSLEINKQRIAAMNLCRMRMEAITGLDNVPNGEELVPLLGHGNLPAKLKVEYYGMHSNGSVDWNHVKPGATLDEPTFARVSVEWMPKGVYARKQRESMQALVTKGLI